MPVLEGQLKIARAELQAAMRSLGVSDDGPKTHREKILPSRDDSRSTNEELLTPAGPLPSIKTETDAMAIHHGEMLEQQRVTANDLLNILYSIDVATLFLDAELRLRLFTPAIRSLFNIVAADLGRPLEDVHALAADRSLRDDIRKVIQSLTVVEHEIETPHGSWCRRILPYRNQDGAVEGLVVTFTDITHSRHAAQALEDATRNAELANAAKSRFLASASHDLRQPLQTLSLLKELLTHQLMGTAAVKLVEKLGDTLNAMSGMLNTFLDISQIEAGIIRAEIVPFQINDLLVRVGDAFTYQAQAHGNRLRILPCHLQVDSDPRLLEQILRNLVSNAIKYTRNGRVLVGCRRHSGTLRVEVWDTGIGIADDQITSIFDEFRQVDNVARERNRGLGLGLSIVRRLSALLNHHVRVVSQAGAGSVFSIDVPIAFRHVRALHQERNFGEVGANNPTAETKTPIKAIRILVVEDDPDIRELLTLVLSEDGYDAHSAADGYAALDMAASIRPDLILTDYNLPRGMNGLQTAQRLREILKPELPVIVLTGDTSTETLSAIIAQRCLRLNKPFEQAELQRALHASLTSAPLSALSSPDPVEPALAGNNPHVIFIVDDDHNICKSLRSVLEEDGRTVVDFESGEAFLKAYRPGSDGCLVVDAHLPGMTGLDLLLHLRSDGDFLPTIVITGSGDVAIAVAAMKAGAADFIEKPIAPADLIASLGRALEQSRDSSALIAWRHSAAEHINKLTPRQRQIMDLVLAGYPSKNIAADLAISQRTVENHRASIMKTTGTRSLPELARLALAAIVPKEVSVIPAAN